MLYGDTAHFPILDVRWGRDHFLRAICSAGALDGCSFCFSFKKFRIAYKISGVKTKNQYVDDVVQLQVCSVFPAEVLCSLLSNVLQCSVNGDACKQHTDIKGSQTV